MTARTGTSAPPDLGPPWLASVPDGAVVIRRTVTQYTVAAVLDGHVSARPEGRRRVEYFDARLIADRDARLAVPGARFWLVAERVRGRAGEAYSAIRFRRDGAQSAEQAFAAGGGPR